MPIIYEFSTAIEKKYSPEYQEWFGTEFKTSDDYDYNSFKNNYSGQLDRIYNIPKIIKDYIQDDLSRLTIMPSENQPAYVGAYINKEWAILAVVTFIAEYQDKQEFLHIKNNNLSPRPALAYRYFCCQNESNESCNLMAILLNWYKQFNYEFDFNRKKEQLLFGKIEKKYSVSLTENAKVILQYLNNQNEEQILNRTLNMDDLCSVISNLPNEQKISFSFAFNVRNRETLEEEGKFRLIQGMDNIISINRVKNSINPKIDKDTIKSNLKELCKTSFTNSLEDKSRLLKLLSSILNQEIEEQLWKHIFDDFNINRHLSGNTPPENNIRLLLMQTICLPERVLELTKLKAKWKTSGNSNNLVVLENFESLLFELITDAYSSKYLIWDEEEKNKPNNSTESHGEENENISDNLDIKSDINADFSGTKSNNLENNESDKDIQNNNEDQRDKIDNFPLNVYSNLREKSLIIINYPFQQKIATLSSSIVEIISHKVQSFKQLLESENKELTADKQKISKETIGNEIPKYNFSKNDYIVLEKLSDRLYDATWQCINQTVESIFDNNDSDVKTDSKRTEKFDMKNPLIYLQNILKINRNKDKFFDEDNYIKILSQDSKLWTFILNNQIAMDFYYYFNEYDDLLNSNLIGLIKFFYTKNLHPLLSEKVYPYLLDIWKDIDPVIARFFYKNKKVGSNNFDKFSSQIQKSEELQLYLTKLSLRKISGTK